MIGQTLIDPAFSARLCLTLLHSVWQFAVILTAVWCLEQFRINHRVERRYAINVAALLVGLLAVPLTYSMTGASRSFDIVAQKSRPISSQPEVLSDSERPRHQAASPALVDVPIRETPLTYSSEIKSSDRESEVPVARTEWIQISPWVIVLYFLVAGLMFCRLFRSMLYINRLCLSAEKLETGSAVDSLRKLTKRWPLKNMPELSLSEHVLVPAVVGLIRPTILLPTSIISGLTPQQLELILAHELAHIYRYDMWVNLLQRLSEALLFFNPSLWFLSRRISRLREYCCDELTCLDECQPQFERKVHYATALLRVVELSEYDQERQRELMALAVDGPAPSEIRRRVARLFGEPLREPLRVRRSMFCALIALLLIGGPAIWSTYAEKTAAPELVQQEAEVKTGADSTQPYSLSGNVEVLSIGTYAETPQRWWDTEGTALSPRPYRVHGVSIPVNENQIGRQLVFRVKNLPQNAKLSWTVSNKEPAGSAFVALKGEERSKGYYAQVFAANQDLKSVDLRVGLANGKWETKIKMDADNSFGDIGLTESALRQNQPIVYHAQMSGPFTQQGDIVVVAMHDIQDREIRIVAIDKQGEIHRSGMRSNTSFTQGAYSIYKARFGDLKLEQLDRFEFQSRPFEYLEIKNLPLNPQAKQKTAENNTAAANSPSPAESAMVSGRIVLEDGSPATTKGYLYYKRKGSVGTINQYVDRFSTKFLPGKTWLRYIAEGYAPVLVGPLELKSGEQRDDVTIVLKPGFSHLLRVQNEKQEPIAGATVSAGPEWFGHASGGGQKQTTNANGASLLEHLADQNYTIYVSAPGYEPLQARAQDLRSQKETTLTLTPTPKTTGVVVDTAGKPLVGANLFLRDKIDQGGGSFSYSESIKTARGRYWGKLITTTDAQGRFELAELSKNADYLFVIEAKNGARVIVKDFQPGQTKRIVIPKRHDLIVKIKGDLSQLTQIKGKAYVALRQTAVLLLNPGTRNQIRYTGSIGADVQIEPTDEGGIAKFLGLAMDLNAGNEKQRVSVSLNYPSGPVKTVDIDSTQETRVEFDLSQLPESEGNKGEATTPKVEENKRKPAAQIKKKINADTSIPVKKPPAAKLSFVIAKHVILLEGKEIITWDEIDDLFKTLPDTSLIRPAFYFTRGTMLSDGYQAAKAKMWELTRKYKFAGHSEGSLWPRTDFRYDQIKTAADLKPDPQNKMIGTIVDQKGTPIEDAEVALILPVDSSISYQAYHVVLVLGRIRNRLEHVMTLSDSKGQFDLYPANEEKFYLLALHPDAGFSLVRNDQIPADRKIKLLPWAGLKTELGKVPNEIQTVNLTNRIDANLGWPEIVFNQYWDDLPQEVKEMGFVYNQIPPLYRATISRSFKQPDGGGISLPGASVNMMPGEKRELGLGPLSEQQSLQLELMRESSRERRRKFEEKTKVK
ncbi:M56 family metallopeptidase [Gimesia fumaroli]|uniref:Regulatory protein BlaR1 n=1 Tax=Gimesia fumaroli TaxID=2527976 RepID=A0A518IJR0_9PLAN|nr:M56 family metallopeptidase [Gimesia fumaroli]QDV53300.1 Regulatory protein BlaR1 [Gimesia fumaroli]